MTDTLIIAPAALASSTADINAIVAVTIREQIITAFVAALRGLLVENGFHGDMGLNVFRCRKHISPENLPCIIIWPGIESLERSEYGGQYCAMKLGIEAMADAGKECPSVVSERMLGDLIQLVFGRTITLFADAISYESGGTDSYPDAGESAVGTKISLNVKYSYLYGNPYSQAV